MTVIEPTTNTCPTTATPWQSIIQCPYVQGLSGIELLVFCFRSPRYYASLRLMVQSSNIFDDRRLLPPWLNQTIKQWGITLNFYQRGDGCDKIQELVSYFGQILIR